jgi:uncharacterized membrane protein
VPFLAAHCLVEDLDLSFGLLNLLCTLGAYLAFVPYLRRFTHSREEVNVGMLLLVVSFPTLNYASGVLTDPACFLITVVAAYLLLAERYSLFVVVVTLGVLVRESLLCMAVVGVLHLFLRRAPENERRRWALSAAMLMPAGLVLLAVRASFRDLPTYLWVPSRAMLFSNLVRPVSWGTFLLALAAPVVVAASGDWHRLLSLGRDHPPPEHSLLLSLTLMSGAYVLYSILTAFMSGRFVWPAYPVLIPWAVAIGSRGPLFRRILAPAANALFGTVTAGSSG